MSKIPRQAIVSIAAVAGAQLAGILLSPTSPGQSSVCLQWAAESISAAQQNLQYAVSPPPIAEGSYYDVRTRRDEPTYPVGQYQATAPVPTAVSEPVARTETVPLSATTPSVSPSVPMSSVMPELTQAEYEEVEARAIAAGMYTRER